jgi:uncharacterized membrane protein
MSEVNLVSKNQYKIFGRPLSLTLVVLYKGILGLIEIVFGLALLVVTIGGSSLTSSYFIQNFIVNELAEDPNDFILHWFLTYNFPSAQTVLHLGVLVLILGLVKIFIAIGIWYSSRQVRNISLFIVATLGIFGLAEISRGFSIFKLVTVVVDFVLLYYLWKVLPKHLKSRT